MKENMEEEKKTEETLSVVFKNGALKKIKKVATDLGIPEERLAEVLTKGVNLIDISKEGAIVTIKKGKEEYAIDLRLL